MHFVQSCLGSFVGSWFCSVILFFLSTNIWFRFFFQCFKFVLHFLHSPLFFAIRRTHRAHRMAIFRLTHTPLNMLTEEHLQSRVERRCLSVLRLRFCFRRTCSPLGILLLQLIRAVVTFGNLCLFHQVQSDRICLLWWRLVMVFLRNEPCRCRSIQREWVTPSNVPVLCRLWGAAYRLSGFCLLRWSVRCS